MAIAESLIRTAWDENSANSCRFLKLGSLNKEFTMSLSLNNASMNVLNGNSAQPSKNQSAKAMFTALKSGDLAGAQKAYNAFVGGHSSNSSLLNANSVFGQLGAALRKGDLASAQNLASTMHGGSGMPIATTAGSTPSVTSGSTGGGSGSGAGGKSGATTSSGSGSSNSGHSSMSLTPAGLLSSMQTSNTSSLLNAIKAQDTADAGTSSSDNLYALLGIGSHINTSA
jgi:hypothetical protein